MVPSWCFADGDGMGVYRSFLRKYSLDNGLRPAEIYVYRFVLAYLIVFCACYKKIWSNSWRDELLFMTCGLCAGSIYFIAENTALEYTLVSNVSLITSVSPLLTAIMVGAIYKSERPSKGTLIGSLVASSAWHA